MQVFHISVTNARSEFDKLLVYCGAACRLGCLSAAALRSISVECRLMSASYTRRKSLPAARCCPDPSSLSTLATSASRQSTSFIHPVSRP